MSPTRIAAVVPCYRCADEVLDVLARMPRLVEMIYVVDDHCPDGSAKRVWECCNDARIRVHRHDRNLGVGGAVITGYRAALADGMEIIVKVDGDGQMDPALIPRFVQALSEGGADYVTGNRFINMESVASMPLMRIVGNSVLSFANKLVTGYWNLMDPTNGFTAIRGSVLRMIPLDKLDRRFFFESDLLFRLNLARARVTQVPMTAVYAGERSNLRIGRAMLKFPFKYLSRFFKRIILQYFVLDFNIASLSLIAGLLLCLAGGSFGAYEWVAAISLGRAATSGTVMVAALPVLLGFQLLLFSLFYDIAQVPSRPLFPNLDGSAQDCHPTNGEAS